jgi:penicillin-binding protein 1C
VFDLLPRDPRGVMQAQARSSRLDVGAADALHLLFLPSGAVLSSDGPVTIRVMGGRRPLSFLVDGAPLPSDRIRREVRANVQVGDMP